MDKKKGATVLAVITAIGAIGGGAWSLSLDFSQTNTNVDDHSTTIGDTITENFFGGLGEEAFMASQCYKNPIPEEYSIACDEWLELP